MSDFSKFRFSVDRGGTFTDVYAEIPGDPGFKVVKLLSEDPGNYADAPREGIRRILEAVTGKAIDKDQFDASEIEWIRMGTTVATNALLERKGARCALVVTKGFGDILQIGNQDRPHILTWKSQNPTCSTRRSSKSTSGCASCVRMNRRRTNRWLTASPAMVWCF
jgi:5-oxoprolinase (ATP-hydrolysing)